MVWRRLIIAGAAIVAILLTILAGSYMWLDSQSGRNFVARKIAAF
jgi:hypothetical protein